MRSEFFFFFRNLALELGFVSWCRPERQQIEDQKRVHFAIMLPSIFANSTFLALKKWVLGQGQSPSAVARAN